MATHYLKTWERFFSEIENGRKTFEIRKNDRDFQTGDVLVLMRCYDDHPHKHVEPAQYLAFRVTYMTTFGMAPEHVCMALGEPSSRRLGRRGSELMGVFDTIKGVPESFDNQVKLWDCEMREFGIGDVVPQVDHHATYSIRMLPVFYEETISETDKCYVLVVDGRIQLVDATRPTKDAPVFSKWGGPEDEENPIVASLREAKQKLRRIVVFEEKHGTRYFDASTDEALHRAALKVLRERFKGGLYPWEGRLIRQDILGNDDGAAAWKFLQEQSGTVEYEACSLVTLEEA